MLLTISDSQIDIENERAIKNMAPVYLLLSLRNKTTIFLPDHIPLPLPRGNFAPANLIFSFLE